MLRRKGFTLAEVLIALLLVGILSSISIQTLRNRDNSAEYEAMRNKAVTNIQGVLHEALYAKMSSEIFSGENGNYNDIMNHLNSRLGVASATITGTDSGNGEISAQGQKMRDGSYYALTQKEGNSLVAELTIDVNGKKAPNREGTDIFKYNVDKFGGILLTSVPDTEPEKEYCPDGVTEKNSDGSNCPKCTDGSMVTTPDRSNCPKCPNGTTERNADGSNCDKCANGTMANADRSNCPKCANGQEANATRSNCPMCPDGMTEKIDAAGSNCPVANECKEPTPYKWDDGSCNQCPKGQIYEPLVYKKCVPICHSPNYYYDDMKKSCQPKKICTLLEHIDENLVLDCIPGYQKCNDIAKGEIVIDLNDYPGGCLEYSNNAVCRSLNGADSYWDSKQQKCVGGGRNLFYGM